MKIYKVWLPDQPSEWLYHCVYNVIATDDEKSRSKITRGKYRGKIRWVNETELVKLFTFGNLRSPEVLIFLHTAREHAEPSVTIKDKVPQALEYIQHGKLIEIGQEVLINLGNATPYEQLVESAGFSLDCTNLVLCFFYSKVSF